MDTTLQVRQRGTLTLPAELRQKYGIEAGDTFCLVDLDGIFALTPMVPMVPELVREIEKARRCQERNEMSPDHRFRKSLFQRQKCPLTIVFSFPEPPPFLLL